MSESFPARRTTSELSIKLQVIYNPLAIAGNSKSLFCISASIKGVLENAERPTSGKETIKTHPLEQIQNNMARGAESVKVNNIFLQPILSERVPVIKTPMIAKACTIDSAPPANHTLSPFAVRYVGK